MGLIMLCTMRTKCGCTLCTGAIIHSTMQYTIQVFCPLHTPHRHFMLGINGLFYQPALIPTSEGSCSNCSCSEIRLGDLCGLQHVEYFGMVLSKQGLTRSSSEDSSRGMFPDILILAKRRDFTAELHKHTCVWCGEEHAHVL